MQLLKPAIVGSMGDIKFYVSTMNTEEILKYVSLKPTDASLDFGDVATESDSVLNDIFRGDMRFTNSIVIAVCGKGHKWFGFNVNDNIHLDVDDYEGFDDSVGALLLNVDKNLFIISGVDTYNTLKDTKDITGLDDIPVIFIEHKKNENSRNKILAIKGLLGDTSGI